MLTDLSKLYPLDRVWLQHAVYQVTDFVADVIWQKVAAFFYFLEKN